MELLYLDETQNATFDEDYHSEEEFAAKLKRLDAIVQQSEFYVLDVGGGNGRFLDSVLDHFPQARGTVLDVSRQLLSRNKPHPRKTLVHGSVDTLDTDFQEQSFDIITINWLLHHLVGPSYETCAENCRVTLQKCEKLLKPGGTIIVAENMFDGFAGCNLPSWLIYRITTLQASWFVPIARRFFNTAGVGVCFRSAKAWQQVFREAGLTIAQNDAGYLWEMGFKRRVMFPMLAIQKVSHRHFYLTA